MGEYFSTLAVIITTTKKTTPKHLRGSTKKHSRIMVMGKIKLVICMKMV
jgi:hypothetical protein